VAVNAPLDPSHRRSRTAMAAASENSADLKRKASHKDEEADGQEGDEWVGPMPSEATKNKKRKFLEFESVYLDNLPSAAMYERSYMHRDVITHIVCSKYVVHNSAIILEQKIKVSTTEKHYTYIMYPFFTCCRVFSQCRQAVDT
uniref:Uncharacterized protein n=1 Tax=Periophthalmus magnuspinnatus TaxID=409849 RepID=A0A3B4AVD7_9GOBI